MVSAFVHRDSSFHSQINGIDPSQRQNEHSERVRDGYEVVRRVDEAPRINHIFHNRHDEGASFDVNPLWCKGRQIHSCCNGVPDQIDRDLAQEEAKRSEEATSTRCSLVVVSEEKFKQRNRLPDLLSIHVGHSTGRNCTERSSDCQYKR